MKAPDGGCEDGRVYTHRHMDIRRARGNEEVLICVGKAVFLLMTIFLTGCASGKNSADVGEPERDSVIQETNETDKTGENSGTGGNDKTGKDGEASGNYGEEEQAGRVSGIETEPEMVYEAPESVPKICVNQLGYITRSDKIAFFFGEELPQEFHVVRADTKEVVFAGYLRDKGYNEAQQEYNGYGDFSEVQERGTYYIEAPILGKSYSFRIGEELYEDVLKEACRNYDWRLGSLLTAQEQAGKAPEGEVLKATGDIAVTLLAYELNASSFTDDTGISESGNEIPDILDKVRYEAEQMLQMQDAKTGAVSAKTPGKEQWEAAFAMVLAKFSYLYQYYDTDFATECLKAADRAWSYAELGAEEEAEVSKRDGWKLAAAAELYRASGKQSFHDYISEYFLEEDHLDEMELPVLLGYVTYISTRGQVDLKFCEEISEDLTDQADQAAKRIEDFLLENREGDRDDKCQELLGESMYLILVNHMITSQEYEILVENILHYLMGRNVQSVNYIESMEEGNCRTILLLSEILNWQQEHDDGERISS